MFQTYDIPLTEVGYSWKDHKDEDCIYVSNLTRKKNIAFIGKISYFGGGLLMLKPKNNCDLNKIVDY